MFKEIEKFAMIAINIIINDIMELEIIVPRLVFDYSTNQDIRFGFYMYQNVSGDIITLNMPAILELKNINDIKTVITYGFIHEIIHYYQPAINTYNQNKVFIEDSADYNTIKYIRDNKPLIESRLKFNFNDRYIIGIERQLCARFEEYIDFNKANYFTKTIAGALCNKLNYNFQYIYDLIINGPGVVKIVFSDREYYIDLNYSTAEELNLLINLIYLTDFNIIKFEKDDRCIILKLYERRNC